jgi:hypothetical protein
MQDDISVHDNHLVAYSVLAKERQIRFQTEFRDREPREFTEVVFDGVLAYDFENDLFGTIIFDILEVDLANFLEDHAAAFENGWRNGWPRGWEPQKESISAYMTRLEMKTFVLSSSYGMHGWIIARGMTKNLKETELSHPIPSPISP